MQTLQTLIDQLEKGRKIHISILDLDGVLNTALTQLDFPHTIHSKPFCDLAKSTAKGYALCRRCKTIANRKAIRGQKAFWGHCAYGLYELAYPVVKNDAVVAVVYAGNAIANAEMTEKRLTRACSCTGVTGEALQEKLSQGEILQDPGELLQLAELVADYMKLLWDASPRQGSDHHWLVSLLKRYAEEGYGNELSLKEIAHTYQKNEKYLGRLFKEQMGVSFCKYYTELRLKRAETLLRNTNRKIIEIALDCGFNTVTYFNRIFSQKYGMSPTAYRAVHTQVS